jgi:hypothetical protein
MRPSLTTWNTAQGGTHLVYHNDHNGLICTVFISDCLKYNTVALHLFQKRYFFSWLQRKLQSYNTNNKLFSAMSAKWHWGVRMGGRGKAIPVTDRRSPYVWETSRLPYFLAYLLTYCNKVVSLMHRPPFTPRTIPGTHYCYMLSQPQGHDAAGRVSLLEKSNDFIGNWTRDLPACSNGF